ncbi:hypothetical protein [Latilactobacillus curvatus]|nr:hypothetical protein [Latilactobacillus curvatus]
MDKPSGQRQAQTVKKEAQHAPITKVKKYINKRVISFMIATKKGRNFF